MGPSDPDRYVEKLLSGDRFGYQEFRDWLHSLPDELTDAQLFRLFDQLPDHFHQLSDSDFDELERIVRTAGRQRVITVMCRLGVREGSRFGPEYHGIASFVIDVGGGSRSPWSTYRELHSELRDAAARRWRDAAERDAERSDQRPADRGSARQQEPLRQPAARAPYPLLDASDEEFREWVDHLPDELGKRQLTVLMTQLPRRFPSLPDHSLMRIEALFRSVTRERVLSVIEPFIRPEERHLKDLFPLPRPYGAVSHLLFPPEGRPGPGHPDFQRELSWEELRQLSRDEMAAFEEERRSPAAGRDREDMSGGGSVPLDLDVLSLDDLMALVRNVDLARLRIEDKARLAYELATRHRRESLSPVDLDLVRDRFGRVGLRDPTSLARALASFASFGPDVQRRIVDDMEKLFRSTPRDPGPDEGPDGPVGAVRSDPGGPPDSDDDVGGASAEAGVDGGREGGEQRREEHPPSPAAEVESSGDDGDDRDGGAAFGHGVRGSDDGGQPDRPPASGEFDPTADRAPRPGRGDSIRRGLLSERPGGSRGPARAQAGPGVMGPSDTRPPGRGEGLDRRVPVHAGPVEPSTPAPRAVVNSVPPAHQPSVGGAREADDAHPGSGHAGREGQTGRPGGRGRPEQKDPDSASTSAPVRGEVDPAGGYRQADTPIYMLSDERFHDWASEHVWPRDPRDLDDEQLAGLIHEVVDRHRDLSLSERRRWRRWFLGLSYDRFWNAVPEFISEDRASLRWARFYRPFTGSDVSRAMGDAGRAMGEATGADGRAMGRDLGRASRALGDAGRRFGIAMGRWRDVTPPEPGSGHPEKTGSPDPTGHSDPIIGDDDAAPITNEDVRRLVERVIDLAGDHNHVDRRTLGAETREELRHLGHAVEEMGLAQCEDLLRVIARAERSGALNPYAWRHLRVVLRAADPDKLYIALDGLSDAERAALPPLLKQPPPTATEALHSPSEPYDDGAPERWPGGRGDDRPADGPRPSRDVDAVTANGIGEGHGHKDGEEPLGLSDRSAVARSYTATQLERALEGVEDLDVRHVIEQVFAANDVPDQYFPSKVDLGSTLSIDHFTKLAEADGEALRDAVHRVGRVGLAQCEDLLRALARGSMALDYSKVRCFQFVLRGGDLESLPTGERVRQT